MISFFKSQGINIFNIMSYAKYKLCKMWVKRHLQFILKENYDFSDYNRYFLDKMLKYATKYVPYYYRFVSCDIKDFPIVCKDDIRDNEIQFQSMKKKYLTYQEFTTGGSTGEPFGFLISPQFDDVFQEFLWKLHGYKENDSILFISGFQVSKEKLDNHIYWETVSNKKPFQGRIKMTSLYLNKNTYQYYYEYIATLCPDFIRGYPSAVYSLAVWIVENNLILPFSMKGIELTSESVFEYQIEIIEKAFNTKVFMQYGHSEACVFGYTYDESHCYRMAPLYGHVEVIGSNGKQVTDGEIGEIVVTSYTNFAQPFIRYRTGDLAKYRGETNGIVELECIYGRTQDFVYNYKKEKVLLTAIVFGLHYKAFNHIIRWQLEQQEYGKVVAYIIPSNGFSKDDEIEIKKIFKEQVGIDMEFVYVEELNLTERGKLKFLLQRIS